VSGTPTTGGTASGASTTTATPSGTPGAAATPSGTPPAAATPSGTPTTTATVSGTPTTAGSYSYTIKMTDSGSPVQTTSNVVSGTIAPAPLTMTSVPSPMTQVGQPYSQTNVGSYGTTPYSYLFSGGALPAGTTLNHLTGTVSGTPTKLGAFSYMITIVDSCGCGWWQTKWSVVSGTIAPPPLSITSAPSSVTRVGQSYSQTNMASGGTTPYDYSVSDGALPPGTTLDKLTGTVSGAPSTGGAFKYTIKATDGGNPAQMATTDVSGATEPAPLIMTSLPSATTQVTQSYSQANVASGGTTPYTFSLSGVQPAGTTLNTSTGTVSGTASTPGSFNYTINVTDGAKPPQTVSNVVIGKIAPPPPIPLAPGPKPRPQRRVHPPCNCGHSAGRHNAQHVDRRGVGNGEYYRRVLLHYQDGRRLAAPNPILHGPRPS
jgi:hypothetical protein